MFSSEAYRWQYCYEVYRLFSASITANIYIIDEVCMSEKILMIQ